MATESTKSWWNDASIGLDLIRIYLGIGLMVRGALFISRPEVLLDLLKQTHSWFIPLAAAQYIIAAHLCGGILLALGLGTRLSAAVQIPPLFGAVLFVHWKEGLLTAGQSLEFAALVLVMLAAFTVFGAGRVSLDAWLPKRNAEALGEPMDADTAEDEAEHVRVHT